MRKLLIVVIALLLPTLLYLIYILDSYVYVKFIVLVLVAVDMLGLFITVGLKPQEK